MEADELEIRALVAHWLRAVHEGKLAEVLALMAEDVVFLAPGQPPMHGRDAFAAGFEAMSAAYRIESSSDIQEIVIVGDLASCWSYLEVLVRPKGGDVPAVTRKGHVLSLLKRGEDGRWRVWRDANMLTVELPPV